MVLLTGPIDGCRPFAASPTLILLDNVRPGGTINPMQAEVSMYYGAICRSIQRVVEAAEALDAARLDWRPPVEGANSVYAIAVHVLANARENLLGTLCGQDIPRAREAEFAASGGSAAGLREEWMALRDQLESSLSSITPPALDRVYTHPRRGAVTGRQVLLVVARHAAEHAGQAELTRDLALAK